MSKNLEKQFDRIIETAVCRKKIIEKQKQLAEENILKLEKKIRSLASQSSEEAEIIKSQMVSLDSQLDILVKEIARCEQHVSEAKEELEQLKQEEKENASYPKERYALNLYKDMTRIKLNTDQSPSELKGFVFTNSGQIKTFCFDKQKQSVSFIANSLWELGDEENW